MPVQLLDRLHPHQATLERLRLFLPTADEVHQHLRQAHWGELPFLKLSETFGDDLMFSLRIDPTRSQQDWTVICSTLAQPGGMTYASSLKTFAVNLLARENTWDGFQAMAQEDLEVLHLALTGGSDLQEFQAGLQYNLSTILPEGDRLSEDGESMTDLRKGEHLMVLDPEPTHVRFRQTLTALMQGKIERQDMASFGPWGSWMALAEYFAFAHAQFLAPSEQEAQPLRHGMGFQVLEHIPQYDGCMLRSFRLRHVDGLPAGGFESAIESLVIPFSFESLIPAEDRYWQDPVAHLILNAQSQARGTYDGLAHIAAAALYDEERGDPVRSFQALQTGTFWAATNKGIVLRPALDAAISLAQRNGCAEVAAALEENAARL